MDNKMVRYLVVEYCFTDDSYEGERHDLGSYPTMFEARKAAGEYIKSNVKKMRKKYRQWTVRVHCERVFWEIRGI